MHISLFACVWSLSDPQLSYLKNKTRQQQNHKYLEEVQRKWINKENMGCVAYKKQQNGLFFNWKDNWSGLIKIYKCMSDTQRVNMDQLLTILANRLSHQGNKWWDQMEKQ